MARIDITLNHQLSRSEARHRVEALLEQLHQRYGSMIDGVEKQWDGSTLMFTLQRGGQCIPGEVVVQDQSVSITLALPWLLSFLKGRVQRVIEEEARKQLER
jgi:putative polyhydroxyalkanoate system protein